ncbi:double-strand break repair protein AddB [Rhodobacter sp. KR11]|uniref:double-strand break repair protein AddB n=1 Tax=Rhodobacter sp. KR11 TaxID=2974588 RepID=UPI0022228D45|nr:double-strand break repair protein AddB [Rhodobacter sp. KR11]MCW1918882.1 double-strand break repair protein AddB [Rhodobacter sp. KR11]
MAELAFLPPGVDFATELVAGLRARHPDLSRVTLYVNSRRMARRVTEELTAGPASFLPRLHVLSELSAHPVLADQPPAPGRLSRLLDLSRLVERLLTAQPDLAPRAALFDLSQSLAALADEMTDEGVAPETLSGLDVSGHSAHWARTQAFLAIIGPLLQGSRARMAAERLAGHLMGPVVVAGSTASRGANLLLMTAVARHPLGALVLPGFDTDMPTQTWAAMDDQLTAEDHPQYRYRRLTDLLGVTTADLTPWTATPPADPDRNRLISLSLRPAPVTDQWRDEGAQLPDLRAATSGLSLILSPSPRTEALALALAIRHAVCLRRKVALITPDRNLARRVTAELDRWGITPDDSAGVPLALSPPGRFLRQVARAFETPVTPDVLVALLKHPLAGSGLKRGLHLLLTRELELHLRRNGPAFPDAAFLVEWAKARPQEGAADWGLAMGRALDWLSSPAPSDLAGHLSRHRSAAEALACEPDSELWKKDAGGEALALMAALQAEDTQAATLSNSDYRRLFEAEIAAGTVRSAVVAHPLVSIHGPREAREVRADTMILAGLNEGIWPAAPSPDPWLNRQMRKDAGLLLPERQIGLSAHDWQQAVAGEEVILSRALRDTDAETVPARWLNRLSNLMEGLPVRHGPESLAAMKARGAAWLTRARLLEEPEAPIPPEKRPAPAPPLTSRPDRLSLTRISTLIRDPYAIYAQYVLRLRKLDPLRPEPDPRDRGNAIHRILETFVKERPEETLPQAKARLLAISETVLAEETPFPSARLLWLSRMERAADHFLRQDRKHGGTARQVETKGEVAVEDTGFTLFGIPDRIDILPDGRLHLIDYKTGAPPTKKQQAAFDLQLHLAAAMAERGGFGDPAEVSFISYIGLSGDKAIDTPLTTAEIDEIWVRFVKLIRAYQGEKQGYTARRAVFEARFPGDYDHLSRFGEWDMTDKAVTVRLTDDPA